MPEYVTPFEITRHLNAQTIRHIGARYWLTPKTQFRVRVSSPSSARLSKGYLVITPPPYVQGVS